MKTHGVILLAILSNVLLTQCASYMEFRGSVLVSVVQSDDEVSVSTYECFFATFSPLTNTSALPFYYIGDACNESDVSWRLSSVSAPEGFIALAERGSCFFTTKTDVAVRNNAKGLIVYNLVDSDFPFVMGSSSGYKSPIPVVSVSLSSGEEMLDLINSNAWAMIDNTGGTMDGGDNPYSKITFCIFIGLTCVVLLVVIIALFLTIYQLWCRCHALWKRNQQEQEAGRAVRRTLQGMKCSRYSVGETTSIDGLHDSCSVCLEEFKSGEVLRILPCTHPFHRDCVDKWLYKKHTCPLCKFDILKGEHECSSEDEIPHIIVRNQQNTPPATTTTTTTTGIAIDIDSVEQQDSRLSISSDELLIPLMQREDTQPV